MKKVSVLLLLLFAMTAAKAQKTGLVVPKTWKVASSLLDKTYTDAHAVLKSHGLKMYEKRKLEEDNLDNYFFVPVSSEKPDLEDEYTVTCKDNRVAIVLVEYGYLEDEVETVLKNDRKEIIKQLGLAGYTRAKGKFSAGMEVYKNKNKAACIYTELDMASFSFIVGDAKEVESMASE